MGPDVYVSPLLALVDTVEADAGDASAADPHADAADAADADADA